MHTQTGRQTDRQTDRHKQTNDQTNTHKHTHIHQTYIHTYGKLSLLIVCHDGCENTFLTIVHVKHYTERTPDLDDLRGWLFYL